MYKSNYKKNKDAQRVLGRYILIILFLISFVFFAGKVQQACIEANGVHMCD